MKEQIYQWLIPVASAVAGLFSSGVIVLIVKKIIKKSIDSFVEKVLKPKTDEVLPNKQLDRIEANTKSCENEILEMRGKK